MMASTDIITFPLQFLNVDEEDVEAEIADSAILVGGDHKLLLILEGTHVSLGAVGADADDMRGGVHFVAFEEGQDNGIIGGVEGNGGVQIEYHLP